MTRIAASLGQPSQTIGELSFCNKFYSLRLAMSVLFWLCPVVLSSCRPAALPPCCPAALLLHPPPTATIMTSSEHVD